MAVQPITDVLQYVNAAVALLLALVAAARMKRGGPYRRWAAAAFAAFAVALLVSALDGDLAQEWAGKAMVCVLLTFPYLLLRFTATLTAVPSSYARVATWWTVAIVVATLALPSFPRDGAPRPGWFAAYATVVVVFWTALSLVTIADLWRGGTAQPTLARRRTRLMSAAVAGLNILIVLAAVGAGGGTLELVVESLLLVSLACFAVGFAPPAWVRLAWRQPEQDELRRAIADLLGATTVTEVTDTLLPHVARVVGGSGAAVYDAAGGVVASFGRVPADEASGARTQDAGGTLERIALSPPFSALVVATSPMTPFFGREEIGLLRSVGALADLALTRCALGERERQSQMALRDAMERAERANLAKSDFLSRMSHELRTPLNVVLGFGQILEMRGGLADKDAEAVEQILKAGRHLLELINEVLDLSRIESGRMAISPEPVELADVTGEAIDLMRPLADDRAVELVADLDCCHGYVLADRQRLKQVLLNLLSNAVKYNRHGGQVMVSCAGGAPGRLRVQVADTGPGIPAELQTRLFEPFDRLGAERRHIEGTGLGLALSRQLVRLMDGELGVETRPGEGSTFSVELAMAAAPPDHDGAPATAEPPGLARPVGQRRVLLIEDNLANLRLIRALTADRAYLELLPAMTARLGLELAREHRPELILLDQHLPDMGGVEVLCRLKADPRTRPIPVVIVSADASPGQIRRLRELGADDYLTKPLDVPRFLRVVDGLLQAEGDRR